MCHFNTQLPASVFTIARAYGRHASAYSCMCFVPVGFEAGGAFGQATLDFLREVEEVAT